MPGCAYINNNCRANNKAEGSTLDSPKLLVPLLGAARFYYLLFVGQEWRQPPSSSSMADKTILRYGAAAAAAATAAAAALLLLIVHISLCVVARAFIRRVVLQRAAYNVRFAPRNQDASLARNRSRARKEPQSRLRTRDSRPSIALVNAPLTRNLWTNS